MPPPASDAALLGARSITIRLRPRALPQTPLKASSGALFCGNTLSEARVRLLQERDLFGRALAPQHDVAMGEPPEPLDDLFVAQRELEVAAHDFADGAVGFVEQGGETAHAFGLEFPVFGVHERHVEERAAVHRERAVVAAL